MKKLNRGLDERELEGGVGAGGGGFRGAMSVAAPAAVAGTAAAVIKNAQIKNAKAAAQAEKAGAGRGEQGGPTADELEGKKSGGAIKAKGWGKARGARAAKVY